MKKWLAFACLPIAGLAAAAAVAAGTATTGTVSVCATAVASTPAHTVGVDGSGVDTIAGDTATNEQCATTTYTIPTVTETTTVGTTTTPAPSFDYFLADSGSGAMSLSPTAPVPLDDSITVAAGAESYNMTDGRHAVYFATPGVTGPQHGTYTAQVKITSAFAGAQVRVVFEKAGVFLAGGWTPYQDASSAGLLTFSVNDTDSTDWTSAQQLSFFVEAKNTNSSGSGTVSWEASANSGVTVPFDVAAPPPPTTTTTTTTPAPSGNVLFDGSAKLLTDLQGHEVCSTCNPTNGPITWTKPPYGTHYFYLHEAPDIWADGCLCFIKDDISLVSDSTFGKAYNVAVAMGDTSPWHGNTGGTTNGAGQLSIRQPNHLGEWQYYGIATKINSWNGPPSDIYFNDIASLGYQTSSNDQVAFGVHDSTTSPGTLAYEVRVNAGYANGPEGNAPGTTHFRETFKPVTFGQWDEFVYAVKWSTHQDGEVKIYNRRPGGTWSVVFDRANIDTYLYGTITYPDGSVRNYAQDGSNWPGIIDKIGLYFREDGQESESVQESGLTISTDLATAESTLP